MEFKRTESLIGEVALNKLKSLHIAIFGVGGVGSYTAEALARCGIGKFDIIDNDVVNITNINRQLIALHSTIGKYKADCVKERILDINPAADVNVYKTFYLPENAQEFDFSRYDYIVDAIDTVSAKIDIAARAHSLGIPVISSMGTGNKLDPTQFEVSDIYKTEVCPLASVMRRELKKRGIEKLKVVYSKEKPVKQFSESERPTPSSISFVPSAAGLIIAAEVVKDLI